MYSPSSRFSARELWLLDWMLRALHIMGNPDKYLVSDLEATLKDGSEHREGESEHDTMSRLG